MRYAIETFKLDGPRHAFMSLPVYNSEHLDTLARLIAEAALEELAREGKSVELTEPSAPVAGDSGAATSDLSFKEGM